MLDDRYELGPVVGRGGMAVVRRGFDRRLGREVAVKLLAPELAGDSDARRRFEQEARAAARISHAAVVSVFDSGEDEGRAYMVMEFLPGATLADVITDGPLPPARVRQLAEEILSGLAAAHEAGIIHRDIKPGNVLFTPEGRAKLGDFGIAKTIDDIEHTRAGLLLGTPAYLAPERLSGCQASFRSDTYSTGVVLYEALMGARPFTGDGPLAVAHAIASSDPQPVAPNIRSVDPVLVDVVERALSMDPAQRFDSAREMLRALTAPFDRTVARTLAMTPVQGPVGGDQRTRVLVDRTEMAVDGRSPRPPRHRIGVAAIVFAAAVTVLVLLVVTSGSDDPPPPPVTTAVAGSSAGQQVPEPLDEALSALERAVGR